MKVIKTREQAKIDQSKHDKWIDKNLKCPECNERVMDDCIERRIFNKFHIRCYCGCEWLTDPIIKPYRKRIRRIEKGWQTK